ncbi:MAG: hypothetical protein H7Z73_03270 [Candidatus Saccharibacteria bacterium]|nr:hypothetical protein [Moraxellaceae bacterium]
MQTLKKTFSKNHLTLALLVTAGLSLSACNDNNNSTSTPTPAPSTTSTLTGTAATGKAFVGKVEAINKAGVKSAPVTIGADGKFTLVVPNGAPYLLHAISPSGDPLQDLYSYAAAAGNTNVTSLTTQAVLDANENKPLAALVNSWATATLNDAKIIASAKKVTANLQSIFTAKGLTDVTKINPFTYSFTAGSGVGLDGVMDQIKFNYNCSATACSYDVKNGESTFGWSATIDTSGITIDLKNVNSNGTPIATGSYTLEIVTTISGITTPVTIKNIPKPANKAEFCDDSSVKNAYSQTAGLTLKSCEFDGTKGRITAEISSPIGVIPYTIDYTYK